MWRKLFNLACVIVFMRRETKRNLFIAGTYGAALLLGLLLGQNYADNNRQSGTSTLLPLGLGHTGKVQRMIDLIAANYVDSVDVEALQDLAISEIMEQLDPHSEYLYAQAAVRQHQALEGSFDGIGIEYYRLNDTLTVVGLIPGGPAEKAGILVGDRLIAINGDTIAGIHVSDRTIEEKMRGRKGTPLDIHIQRAGRTIAQPLRVVRDRVEVSSIDAAYIVDSVTAYVKVKRFGANTASDFETALKNLKNAGAKRLVLDLRENKGGYFSAATALASQFFADKKLLVYTEGAHEDRTDYYSAADGLFGKGALAVLIDEQSASASEIVAGAVQDLNRGIIVGRTSFGKGLVQEQFGFGDGSALNLTVARYYTPLGRCIQKTYPTNRNVVKAPNASPRADLELTDDTHRPAAGQADLTQFNEGGSSIEMSDRSVLSGGITPDVWVPFGSQDTSTWYQRLRKAGIIEEYVYGRLAQSVPTYSADHFLAKYRLPDEVYADFVGYTQARGIPLPQDESPAVQALVRTDIEALLGRFYFGSEVFFRVRNRSDEMLAVALDALEKGS